MKTCNTRSVSRLVNTEICTFDFDDLQYATNEEILRHQKYVADKEKEKARHIEYLNELEKNKSKDNYCDFCGRPTTNRDVDPYESEMFNNNTLHWICYDCYESHAGDI